MKKVAIDDLKPGMTLAKPVLNEGGMILLSEGTVLKDSHIERLQNIQAPTVFVEGAGGPSKSKEELLAELDARFRKTENEPYMATLKRIIREQIVTSSQ